MSLSYAIMFWIIIILWVMTIVILSLIGAAALLAIVDDSCYLLDNFTKDLKKFFRGLFK